MTDDSAALTSSDSTTGETSTDSAADPNENRSTTPKSSAFSDYISSQWEERVDILPAPSEAAPFAAARRDRLAAQFPNTRIVIEAGDRKVRSNDTDYPYRAHSDFSYLTGWGSEAEPGSVLVLEPDTSAGGHTATLYFRERAGRDSDEFYANPEIGEFWIGARPSLIQVAAELGIATADLADFEPSAPLAPDSTAADPALIAQTLSEYRLVKDSYEIAQLRGAVAATASGFDDIVGRLPAVSGSDRGERIVEGVFYSRARLEGNAVGYDTIAASGPHATILHWTRNDGPLAEGDLILVDAGIELDSLYTADITRTLPVNGRFSPVQRMIYEAVREAADAAFAIVRPGIVFRDIHNTAMQVIAAKTAEWGLLPVDAEASLLPENQHHRRYMVHGTSHHLGLDVHDCAKARRDMYMDGVVAEGMTFTIEPGLYFQSDDLTVPVDFRGIGVRIEDNILVTAHGAENLSSAIPRTATEVEAWLERGGLRP